MKKLIYYNWTRGCLSDEFGDPISGVPSIAFGERPQWELVILEEEGGRIREGDLSGVTCFRAALDADFTSSTEVMCRTLPENITSSGNRITLTLDASTTTFLAAVDGKQSVPAFFEINGMDDAGSSIFHLLIPVLACMMLDPLLPEELPPSLGEELWAQKVYVDAAIKKLDADGDGVADKAALAQYAESAGVAGRAESIQWEDVQNKIIPTYSAGGNLHLSEDLVFSLDTAGASQGQILCITSEGEANWKTPDSVPENPVKVIVSSVVSSAVLRPDQINGAVSSAVYASSAGSILWGGIAEKPEVFPPDESLLSSFLTSGGSSGQVFTHNGSSFSWQSIDVVSSGGAGTGTGSGITAVTVAELDENNCMAVPGVPVSIVANTGNIYPVSGGFVTSSSSGYLIDPAPYLLAESQEGFTGSWIIYILEAGEE